MNVHWTIQLANPIIQIKHRIVSKMCNGFIETEQKLSTVYSHSIYMTLFYSFGYFYCEELSVIICNFYWVITAYWCIPICINKSKYDMRMICSTDSSIWSVLHWDNNLGDSNINNLTVMPNTPDISSNYDLQSL